MSFTSFVCISGGFRGGGALGASAPPAESIVKKILNYLFPSQWTIGTFLCVLLTGFKVSILEIKTAVNCHT